jgi:hypothetical protein
MLEEGINTSKGHNSLQEGVEATKWRTCLKINTSIMEFTTTMNNKMKKMLEKKKGVMELVVMTNNKMT